jgi:hypothetical protein
MPSKNETPEDEKQPATDPKLEAVQPAQDESTPPVEPATEDAQPPASEPSPELPATDLLTQTDHGLAVANFADKIEQLVDHAGEQAQVTSEYQDRWAWWHNHLEAFLREVKQHV